MKKSSEKKSISGIAALLLLAVFAAGILSVLLSGAGVYKRLAQRSGASYDVRTSVRYISTKLRQAPNAEAVSVSDFGDGDGFDISEWVDGKEYRTRIYCYDGWLMELYSLEGAGLAPEDGEKILPAQNLDVTDHGGLLRIGIEDAGGGESVLLFSLSGGKTGGYEE